MGILRTDKISGLETPTAVTGSVNFPGLDDYITAPANTPELLLGDADFTIEGWFYKTNTGQQDAFGLYETANNRRSYLLTVGDSSTIFYYNYTGSSGTDVTADATLPLNKWAHVAITRDGTTLKIYVDGNLSGTTTGLTAGAYANTTDQFMIGSSDYSNANGSEWTGHISNLRIVKGYVLYDGDFTVPDHALEVVPGTVLLACNNPDSVTASESALIGKGLTLTASGNPNFVTKNPGLSRDFTFGTEFKGVTTFDTQGYFVPPSGTTTERYPTGTGGAGAGTRGVVFGGYYASSPNRSNVIDYITIATLGNAQDFGDRLNTTDTCAACASATRALNAGGYNGSATINTIEYVTIASTGNAVDFGDTRIARRNRDGCASSTRGLFGGGYPIDDAIDYVTIATQGTSSYFGNLTSSRYNVGGLSSPTRGVFAGGQPANGDTIEYVTIATTGDAVDFGNLTASSTNTKGASSTTRGIFGHNTNVIDYITIASLGDAQDFGDLNYNPNANTCTSSLIRGVFMGGGSPTIINTISYITIASTGDAVDFGDLTQARQSLSATSSGHGGLG